MDRNKPETTADDLIALIDGLIAAGTQHINLEVGAETQVQTVNSTECSKPGACSVPNFDFDDETGSDEESDDDAL